MGFQMAMAKILQFLGGVSRYYYYNGEPTEIKDADWDKYLEALKAYNEGKSSTKPNPDYAKWFWYDKDTKTNYGQETPEWVCNVIAPILNVLNTLLIPVIIILGVAGMIYGIVLGVQYSKAETADKREELKKRLISAVIGIGIALVVLIVMKVLIQNAPKIFGWVQDESGNGDTSATTNTPAITPENGGGSGDQVSA